MKASLPSDWPSWGVDVVESEAREFSAEVHRPWAVHDEVLAKSVKRIWQELDRTTKRNLDLEAEEDWWDRFDSGSMEAEIERALTTYADNPGAPEARNPMDYLKNSYDYRRKVDILGERVAVFRNLHKKGVVYSVESRFQPDYGRVLGYADDILLKDVTFAVNQGTPDGKSGRAYVLKTKKKTVHAYVIGRVMSVDETEIDRLYKKIAEEAGRPWEWVTYNPYKYESFVRKEDERAIFKAKYARGRAITVANAAGNPITLSFFEAITDLPAIATPNKSASARRHVTVDPDGDWF